MAHSLAGNSVDPERAWQQVLAHDGAADGHFVYAVETTGIFCRPSCPSRRPARRNIHFLANAEAAMAAGYRACRRCHPAGAHAEAEAVEHLCKYLRKNLDRLVSLRELGTAAGLSPFTVQRMFERVLGVSPRHFQIELRAERLRDGLMSQGTVTEAVYNAGFGSPSRVYEGAMLGMAPRSFRAKGTGEHICFASAACSLGVLLVAVSGRGVCHVALGEDAAALEAELRRRFARAMVVAYPESEPAPEDEGGSGEPNRLQSALRQILTTLTETPVALQLPLDIRATAFQQRVWRALREIPRGETRSYSEIAAALGQPRAVRAVAGACARNELALVIPCHRVVGRDGALTGYRWGTERKQGLLALERGGRPAAEGD